MTHVDFKLILVVVMVVVKVGCQNNTTSAPAAPAAGPQAPQSPSPQPQQNKPGALASLMKMIIDIPMGVIEACRDGAEALESIVIGVMRSIFK